MTRQEYLDRAAEVEEEGGDPVYVELLLKMAKGAPEQIAEESPPPGPRADETPFIGQRTSEIGTVASEPPQPVNPSVSLGSADAGEVLPPPPTPLKAVVPPPREPTTAIPGRSRAYVGALGLESEFDKAAKGRAHEVDAEVAKLNRGIREIEPQLIKYNRDTLRMTQTEAEESARHTVREIRRTVIGPSGEFKTTGEDSYLQRAGIDLPWFRETRIDKVSVPDPEKPSESIVVERYIDPETGEQREPTTMDRIVESFAQQEVLDPAEEEQARAIRKAEEQGVIRSQAALAKGSMVLAPEHLARLEEMVRDRSEPTFENILTERDPEQGRVTETAFGAVLGSLPAVTSTIINQAIFDVLPVFWEQNPETGEPVDPQDPAYRVHAFMREHLKSAGLSEEKINERLTGWLSGEQIGTGKDVDAIMLPIPFQPIQREQPQPMDPAGRRVATSSGDFIARAATSLARRRSLGDEYMSMPALRGDVEDAHYEMSWPHGPLDDDDLVFEHGGTTSPYWVGIATEMLYGFGPLAIPKAAVRTGAKTLGAAAKAAGMDPAWQKAAVIAGSPWETTKKMMQMRNIQDLTEGRIAGVDDFTILQDRHTVAAVAGRKTSGEVISPHMIQAKLISSPGVTAGELKNLIGGTKSGQYVLDNAGVSGLPRSHVLTAPQVRKVTEEVNTWRASAFKDAADLAMSKPGTDKYKATRILNALKDADVDVAMVRNVDQIEDIAKGVGTVPLHRAVDNVFGKVPPGALPVRANRPLATILHSLGNQIVRTARSKEARHLEGPLAPIVYRRLGDKTFGKGLIQTNAEEVFEAAVAAGGRATEATLENVLPTDMVFVTRGLMVPRSKVTRELFDEVAQEVAKVDDGPVQLLDSKGAPVLIDGEEVTGYLYQNPSVARQQIVEAFGQGTVNRSETLSRAMERIKNGELLSPGDHAIVQDGIQERAFRRILDREAKGSVFAGPQIDRAELELVNLGLEEGLGKRVARRRTAEVRQDVKSYVQFTGREIARAFAKVKKAFGVKRKEVDDFFPRTDQTPAPLQRLKTQMEDEVGGIGDAFQKELRDTAVDFSDRGLTPQDAQDAILGKRQNMVMDDAASSVRLRVDDLRSRFPALSEKDAYYFVAYQAGAGSSLPGLGEMRLKALGIPDDMPRIAIDRAHWMALEDAWASIIKEFFGDEVFTNIINRGGITQFAVKRGTKRGKGYEPKSSDLRPITVDNIREVMEDIREVAPALEKRGKAVVEFGGFKDAILPTAWGWAINTDVAAATARAVREARDLHPEFFSELIPTARGARPARVFKEASLPGINRRGTLEALVEARYPEGTPNRGALIAQGKAAMRSSAPYQDIAKRATNAKGEYIIGPTRVYKYKQEGRWVGHLDGLSKDMSLSVETGGRETLVNAVFKRMLETGTMQVGIPAMLGRGAKQALDLHAFGAGAQTRGIRAMLWGMGKDVLRAAKGTSVDPEPTMLKYLKDYLPQAYDAFLARAFNNSKADMVLYDNFLEATVAQMAKGLNEDDAIEAVITTIHQTMKEKSFGALLSPAVDELLSTMRGYGFAPGVSKGELDSLMVATSHLDPLDPAFTIYGQQFVQAVEKIKAAAADGSLTRSMESLLKRDKLDDAWRSTGKLGMGRLAADLIMEAWRMSKRATASGLLAGGFYVARVGGVPIPIPAPIPRYMGMNLITAPLIGLTTVGAANAVRMLKGPGYGSQARDVVKQVSSMFGTDVGQKMANVLSKPLVDAISPKPRSALAFTTVGGRKWTKGELDDAIARRNIGATRGSVEFNDAFVDDLIRDSGLQADAAPAGPMRKFLRNVDPTRTNIFQYFANATDRAFRENMFASALKQGMTEPQAARMARASVLDYGRVDPAIKTTLNRYFMFIAFRASMFAEVLDSLARGAPAFNRTMLAQRNIQQSGDQWYLGEDYLKNRIIFDPKEYIFDGRAGSVIAGPSIPAMDTFNDMVNLATYFAQLGAEGNEAGNRLLTAVSEEQLLPIISSFAEMALSEKYGKGKGSKVPDVIVAYAVQTSPKNLWPWMVKEFNIVPVSDKDRTPGRPTVKVDLEGNLIEEEVEYRFGSKPDSDRFRWYMVALTMLAGKRATEDWTKTFLALDGGGDVVNAKRRALAQFFGFMVGWETPIGLRTPEELEVRALRGQQRKLVEKQAGMK